MANELIYASPVTNYLQGRQAAQQNQLGQQQLQANQQQMAQQQAQASREDQFRNALSAYLQGGSNSLAELYTADPEKALQIQAYQTQQNELQRAQQAQKAKEAYIQAGSVLNSKAPAHYIRLLLPNVATQWAEHHGKPVEEMTDDDAKELAQQTQAAAGAQAGIVPKIERVDLGDRVALIDDTGREVGSEAKGITPGEKLTAATARRGQDLVDARDREKTAGAKLSENDQERVANAIANYKQAPFGSFALAKPANQQIMARVMELNPDYNANEFAARKKAFADFSTGKNGNAIRSFNVGLAHLDTLSTLTDALDNHDFTLVNKIANSFKKETGSAAPTNFDAAKKIVGDEIVKMIVGSGGGVEDRKEVASTISRTNSPAQLKGVIETYQTLMGGQLTGLQQQFEHTTGRKDFAEMLSPEALKYLHTTAEAPAAEAPLASDAALLKKWGGQ